MDSTEPINLDIWRKLTEDAEYKDAFFQGKARDEIAAQIRELREKRTMSQNEFAEACGMKQSAISRIEQSEYSGWTFKTLMRIAKALKANWTFKLEPEEETIERYRTKEVDISGRERIEPPHAQPNFDRAVSVLAIGNPIESESRRKATQGRPAQGVFEKVYPL